MLGIDLTGKHVFVAGVGDDVGFGFSICKAFAEAGAKVSIGTWPPAYKILTTMLARGKMDASMKLSNGESFGFEKIYPFDAVFDTYEDIPETLATSKRYRDAGDVSISGVAKQVAQDVPTGIDIVVHSLANGPEVKKPLLETSRNGYLEAISASSYSFVSMAKNFAPLMPKGGAFLCLSYLASQRAVPGYGGGMSSAKAALESDTRTLAFELGRKHGLRVNAISAGAYASRAASAIGFISEMVEASAATSPIPEPIQARDVGNTAAFLCSNLASGITGTVTYVDNGYHIMGRTVKDT